MKDTTLDIMFYDKSEWAGKVQTFSFINGGKFYRLFRGVEKHAGFESLKEALEWITTVEPDKKIDSIQFWGHGFPGGFVINEEEFRSSSLKPQSKHYSLLKLIKDRLKPESVIWIRSCSTFAGERGKKFAKDLAKFFGCTVASYTFKIGPWQAGLHTLKPGQEPQWPDTEGFVENKEGKLVSEWSKPWSINSIFCLTGKIPKNW